MTHPPGMPRACVVAFLDPPGCRPVEDLRARWDPVSAAEVAAHVTLVYPEEFPCGLDPADVAAAAATATSPFRIAVGGAFHPGSPADGVFLRVEDLDGGIARFRAAAALPGTPACLPAHVTVVHPRAPGGERAWAEVSGLRISARFTVSRVAVTVHDGTRWQSPRVMPLAGPA